MAGTGPDDLHALAVEFLDAIVEALDTIPVFNSALDGAPERAFVSPGTPVFDCCDQIAIHPPVVSAGGTSPGGLAEGKRHVYGMINHVSLLASVTRCIPTIDEFGRAPSVASLQASAEQLNADGWALWNHLYNLQSSGLLLSLCDQVFFDGINATAPSGGCAGWTVSVRAYLDGYSETLGT